MQTNSWHHKLFISPFESKNCGKKGEKLQKFEYLKNEKRFLDEIKSISQSFEGLSFGEKIESTSFKQKINLGHA